MTGDEDAVVAWVLSWALPRLERENGGPWPQLREITRRKVLEARAARFVGPVASVTSISAAPSFPRCSECGRPPAEKLRRGLCDACYRRARRRGNTLAG